MRVFVDAAELVSGELVVRGDEHHYLGRVRRAATSDSIELLDGHGQRASATIIAIGPRETRLRVGAVERVPPPQPVVRVLVPLIKGDRMDDGIEKLVEVGVSEIVVWRARRSVVRLGLREQLDSRRAHYRAVAKAAARQSGCTTVPGVIVCDSLEDALSGLPAGVRFTLVPSADRAPVPSGAQDVTLVSGPEGGLAPDESETLAAAGFLPLGLGPRVLRAETAPVVAVALVRAATNS
jgi:16S rRNA (uracil1498-N3)-methyltransferase